LSVPPGPAEDVDVSVDFDVTLPTRDAPFSDVTPAVWSNLELGKLASPLFMTPPWQPPTATDTHKAGAWGDVRARVAAVVHRYRAWWMGGAIALMGALGTSALVGIARKPQVEGVSAAIVAPRPAASKRDAVEPAPAPSDVQALANEPPPAEAASSPTKKGAIRDKTSGAPRTSSRAPDAPATHAPPAVREPPPAAALTHGDPPTPPPPPLPSFGGVEVADEFNRTAAMEAMRRAGDSSRACVTGGASGGARVAVTFARSGSVSDVGVEGAFAGTPIGNCIAGKFRTLVIPPFRGSSVAVRRTLSF
jgi:hypothetical protein